MELEFRGRCLKCNNVRMVWGDTVYDLTHERLEELERRIDKVGSVEAHCPLCDEIEEVAFLVDGRQPKPWERQQNN